jgi:hypothetical protein
MKSSSIIALAVAAVLCVGVLGFFFWRNVKRQREIREQDERINGVWYR